MSGPLPGEGVPRSGLSFALAFASLVLGSGCVPEYHPPTPAEPHAIVKIRRSYEAGGGTTLYERLLVDDHSAFESRLPAQLAGTPHIDSTLVWAIQAGYTFHSDFFHTEMRQVFETYYEQVPSLESESY